jgi:hypothetical protein
MGCVDLSWGLESGVDGRLQLVAIAGINPVVMMPDVDLCALL